MKQQDFQEFAAFLTEALAFWRTEVSRFSLDVWWQAMRPFELNDIRGAFGRHAMNPETGQFSPKPADVVKMLGGTTGDRALRAWSKVDKAVRQVGPHRSVAFDDPLIHRVLHEMGGWVALSNKTEDEWPFVAKEFENRYRGYSMRGEQPEYPRLMVGISDAENERAGRSTARDVILIGDANAAQRVMSCGTSAPLLGMTRLDAGAASQRLLHGNQSLEAPCRA